MSRNYDNWEKLVDAVTKRQEYLRMAHAISRSPSVCSEISDSSPLDDVTDITFQIATAGRSSSTLQQQIMDALRMRSFRIRENDHSEIRKALALFNSKRQEKDLMKVVIKIDFNSVKSRDKAMKVVSSISGVYYIGADMTTNKLTLVGHQIDALEAVIKLRKWRNAELLEIGLVQEIPKK